MGCQSDVVLGANLVFSVCTHDPDTGVLTNADALPTYRIYEDETAVAILTGTMAALDAANTTGFYTEQIACTTANGFEQGRSYTVYIEATVDTDTGGIAFSFRVFDPWQVALPAAYTTGTAGYILGARIPNKTDLIGTGRAVVTVPVNAAGDVTVIQGDSYLNAHGRRLEWASTTWAIAVDSTLVVIIRQIENFTATRLSATAVGLELTTAQTAALTVGAFPYSVQEIKSTGQRVTLTQGDWTTLERPIPLT